MQFNAKLTLIGTEPYHSAKTGKDYLKVAMSQGADTIDFLTTDFDLAKATVYKTYDCVLSYNTKYKRLDLEAMKTV